MQRILRLFQSTRYWVLLANLATRGAGFAMSFLIARILGAHALGEYSTLVNTASSAIQPFVQVTTNNSVLLAHEANSRGTAATRSITFAGLLLTAGLSAVSSVVYLVLQHLTHPINREPHLFWLESVAATSFVVSQLLGGVLLGCYYGTGQFFASARIVIVTSLLTVATAVPTILLSGLMGAYAILALSSIAVPLVLGYSLFRRRPSVDRFVLVEKSALQRTAMQFRLSIPSIGRAAVAAASFWVCTVYFVKQSFGVEGIGLIAVAMQWLTLIMLTGSSWSVVSLKVLADAVSTGDPHAVQWAIVDLLKKNLMVTLAVSLGVALGADWIAQAYRLDHTDVALLLRLNCCCALFLTCNELFAQLLLCLNRQTIWFLFSLVGFVVQLMITATFIKYGLFAVILASMAGALVVLLLCTIGYSRLVSRALTAKT